MTEPTPRRGAFFDRDGVLNVDDGYVGSVERLRWMPGAREAVARLSRAGYAVFVVTNQSGVARGYYDEEAVRALHLHMRAEIEAMGGRVTDFRYCPHLPDAPVARYGQACECRKPAPGMILDLIGRYGIDRQGSFMIGDKESDMQAAEAAGVQGFLFEGSDLSAFLDDLIASGAIGVDVEGEAGHAAHG